MANLSILMGTLISSAPLVIVSVSDGAPSTSILSWLAPSLAVVAVLLGLVGKWIADVRMQKREMKRSCYMDAAMAAHGCIRSISSMLDPTRPVAEASAEYVSLSAPFASVQVVAGLPLCLAVLKLTAFLGQMHSRLVVQRSRLDPLQSQCQFLDSLIAKSQVAIEANLEELKRYHIDGHDDTQRLNTLHDHFDFLQKQQNDLDAEKRETLRQAEARSREMAQALMEEMEAYPPIITEALRCVRKELGFSFDERAFLAAMRATGALAKETFRLAVVEMDETAKPAESDTIS
jgi:hypothetical protein